MGSLGGIHDHQERGVIIIHILRYLQRHTPRVCILENVKGLVTHHAQTFLAILQLIAAIVDSRGARVYSIFWKVLDSMLFGGVPQRRTRVWIVLVRRDGRPAIHFTWPEEIPCRHLDAMFDTGSEKLFSYKDYDECIPKQKTAARNIVAALQHVKALALSEGCEPTKYAVIVDIGGSKPSWGVGHCPCITATRASSKAFWSLQHGRRLTISEMLRLQGFDPTKVVRVGKDSAMGSRIGNSFTLTVLSRVMDAALSAAVS